MSTRTIEPIHIVLPDADGGYYRFGDLPRLIADALYPEHPDDEAQELQWMKHAIDGVEKYKRDLARAAGLADGEPGYLHVVENSASKRPLEWRSGAVLNAGLVHLDWLNEWGESRKPPHVFSTAWAPEPQAEPGSARPTPVAKETPAERRARWLDMFEAEEKREKRGALQRLANSEGVDRSNMGKDIAKARAERDTQRRAGGWASQLVQDGKRKG